MVTRDRPLLTRGEIKTEYYLASLIPLGYNVSI
jgi:hypothetical protein